ncbi:hypothetical protein XENTR_v10018961 [Xenopus tropicalis]|nr:hypothetical protein XENTR_v10018961 [Xenopus tropicalis]
MNSLFSQVLYIQETDSGMILLFSFSLQHALSMYKNMQNAPVLDYYMCLRFFKCTAFLIIVLMSSLKQCVCLIL